MSRVWIVAISIAALVSTADAADFFGGDQGPSYSSPSSVGYNWNGGYVGVHGGYGWGEASVSGIATLGDIDGLVGGVHAGFNYLYGSAVFGAEFDVSMAGMDGFGAGVTAEVNWLSTLRGRAGIAADRFLFYGTAGLAFVSAEASFGGLTVDGSHWGWAGGIGIETYVTNNIIGRVEWIHYDVGQDSYLGLNADGQGNVLRAGASLKF